MSTIADEDLTSDNLNDLTNAVLKKELKARGLSQSGKKSEMIQRLEDYREEQMKSQKLAQMEEEKQDSEKEGKKEEKKEAEKKQEKKEEAKQEKKEETKQEKKEDKKQEEKKEEPVKKVEAKQEKQETKAAAEVKQETKDKPKEGDVEMSEAKSTNNAAVKRAIRRSTPTPPTPVAESSSSSSSSTSSTSSSTSSDSNKQSERKIMRRKAPESIAEETSSVQKRQRVENTSESEDVLQSILEQSDAPSAAADKLEAKAVETKKDKVEGKQEKVAEAPRTVPPSAIPATNTVRIDNFRRPFREAQVKEMLSKHGTLSLFWMNQIKSRCFAIFENADQAESCRQALHGLVWPSTSDQRLAVTFCSEQDAKNAANPSAPAAAKPSQPAKIQIEATITNASPAAPSPVSPQVDRGSRSQRQVIMRTLQRAEGDLKTPAKKPAKSQVEDDEDVKMESQEGKGEGSVSKPVHKPAPTAALDQLFKKTVCTPSLYWMPLAEEDAEAKDKVRKDQEDRKRAIEAGRFGQDDRRGRRSTSPSRRR